MTPPTPARSARGDWRRGRGGAPGGGLRGRAWEGTKACWCKSLPRRQAPGLVRRRCQKLKQLWPSWDCQRRRLWASACESLWCRWLIVRVPSAAGNRRLQGAAPRPWLLREGSEPASSWNGKRETAQIGYGGRNLAASPDRKEGGKIQVGRGEETMGGRGC